LPAGQSSPTGGGPNSLAPISGTLNFGGSDTATTPGVTAAPLAGTTPLWLWLLLLIAGVVIARKATA
jgi:hypothetical protein